MRRVRPDPPGESISARLLDEAPHRRRLAVAAIVPAGPEAIFALRSVLARDEDATVRARAAERLRGADPRAIGPHSDAVGDALADALRDTSPLVREAAAHAAGAMRSERAGVALREALRSDPAWQVRRSAARALARIAAAEDACIDASRTDCTRAGTDTPAREAAAALLDALDDPFWRVRYAAIQALAELPAAPPLASSREPTSARQAAALAYLDAIRGGSLDAEATPPEPELVDADPPEAALGDDDPAVVAARLASAPPGRADRSLLIAALASPHASLRRAAVRVLAMRGRVDEIAAALAWLDEPRVLYAAGAARRLIARAGSRGLIEQVLADAGAGPGALAWAVWEAARLGLESAAGAAGVLRDHPTPAVRRAALRALARLDDEEAITSALSDPDEATRAEAASMLAPLADEPDVREALDPLAARIAEASPRGGLFVARALLEIARRWLGKPLDEDTTAWIDALLRRATSAPWADVRAEAVALRARRGSLDPEERAALVIDPDPWVREAAMDAVHAPRALAEDPDPFVRRAAAREALAPLRAAAQRAAAIEARRDGKARTRNDRGRSAVAPRPAAAPAPVAPPPIAVLAAGSEDAWIRATAAGAIDPRTESGLALLLRLTRDATPMVRAAAADAIDRAGNVKATCMHLVVAPDTPEDVLLAAHARLVESPGPEGLSALESALRSRDLSPAGREALRATALAYPDEVRAQVETVHAAVLAPAAAPSRAAPAPRAPLADAPIERRPLGRTGLHVAPLGLSGAGEISPAALDAARAAGVNLFFWEPRYRALTEFASRAARRHDLVMVAGSYEADTASIERDAERALRRLRIDALGVMLLFWVRSRPRLEEGAFEALERLKRQGKVRAIGFSTHLRDLAEQAIAAQPWDVVMCRLSAAHPGAERSLLPAAAARGTGVIAFSALCYGRLLGDPGSGVTAADCYRYALSQPGVSVCLSAPRRWREVAENLAVLPHPTLPPEGIALLRAHGERVHAANKAFSRLVHRA